MDDVVESELALKKNPHFRRLMAERYAITDVDTQLAVDPWCAGAAAASAAAG